MNPAEKKYTSNKSDRSDDKSSESKKDEKTRQAAANIIRNQIDEIFKAEQDADDARLDGNPYERTHSETSADTQIAKKWQDYHNAWQNYYRQYYEGYYKSKNQNDNPKSQKTIENEAVLKLRRRILSSVNERAKKVRKSRHFIPILSGIAVMLLLLFMQYNQIIIGNIVSYVSPGNINPQDIIINSDENVAVGADPKLIIPKINVDVPIIFGAGSDYSSQMAAMQKGVAQFSVAGANANPGEIGNTVIAGHSSNDLFDSGDYKFIFAQLDKLNNGDIIYVNYKSVHYTYSVVKKEVVDPTNVSALVYTTSKPMLTLITCTPLGTSKYRLLVTAEQISPDYSSAPKSSTSSSSSSSSIPGNAQTLFEKLFNISH